MAIDIDTSEAPAFIRITLTGEFPTIDEQRLARQRVIDSGQLTNITRALFDFRNLATTADYSQVGAMIAAAMKAGGLPLFRAYLVGSAVQYGLVRQMKALAPSPIELEIFTDENEALMWLWRNEHRR